MKFYSSLFDTDKGFRKDDEVINAITTSKNYKNEPISEARALNFFKTSKQRSYLVATDEMVYCIVDDTRKDQPKVNWSESKDQFVHNAIKVKSKTDKTGFVDFGENHKNWLYSKSKLQDEEEFKEQISQLLSDDI